MVLYPHLIQPGSTVVLHYAIRLEDGTEVESSFGEAPETLVIGQGELMPGFELALTGLAAGQRQTLTLSAEQAYGSRDPQAVGRVPRERFPPDMTLEPGTIISFDAPDGQAVPGTVMAVEGDQVEVDFNHPLAGHSLVFEVEILQVQPPQTSEE
jgi:FKBP-type peptidyl-prolyl cis-trans isomerase SlpA